MTTPYFDPSNKFASVRGKHAEFPDAAFAQKGHYFTAQKRYLGSRKGAETGQPEVPVVNDTPAPVVPPPPAATPAELEVAQAAFDAFPTPENESALEAVKALLP